MIRIAETGPYCTVYLPDPLHAHLHVALFQRHYRLLAHDGELHEFAELFQRRNDAFGDYNRAVLFSLGAGWCEPCKEETEELPGVSAEFASQGFATVQVLFQDDVAGLPSTMFCREWTEDFGLDFLVLLDQTGEFFPTYLQDVQAATPVSIVVDANANIRYKLEGDVPPNIELEIEQVLEDPYGD